MTREEVFLEAPTAFLHQHTQNLSKKCSVYAMPGLISKKHHFIPVDAHDIAERVARHFGYKRLSDILGTYGGREKTWARQVCYYILKETTQLSLSRIAEILHGRDHTTALTGINRVKDLMDTEEPVRMEIEQLKGRILWS